MKILVTGAAGFIGANYVYYELANDPHVEIIALDALTYAGNPENLLEAKASGRCRFVHADITDKDCIRRVLAKERPEVVVNFAAESHVDRSIEDSSSFLSTNIIGTQVLMDVCMEAGVRRFHQVSTDEVYGDLPLDRKDLLFTEKTPLCSSSPYSASKAAADLLVLSYVRTHGFPATISRCSNNYGPYQFPEKLIPLMITNACSNLQLPVYGKGENVRDWLFVDDHCSAIAIILRSGTVGEIYNIGGNNEWSNIDVVKLILEIVGKKEELITFVEDRKGHDLRYAIDSSKIQNELGWRATTEFREGLAFTVKWYVENNAWVENIRNGSYHDDDTIRILTGDPV